VLFSWYQFGEAYSALRGWRPIPAAPRFHSVLLVPGPKIIPFQLNGSKISGAAPLRFVTTLTNQRV